jgi:YbbR domain-containing protein
VSWGLVTEDWRLKLLAGGLAVLMLGAVAFSQNPPTTLTLTVQLRYNLPVPDNIFLLNPPGRTSVTYTGLADVIKNVNSTNLSAFVDATHATPGSAVKLNVSASTPVRGVTVVTPAPIVVDIDALATKDVPVSVNAHAASGWRITSAVAMCPASPCVAHFTGPASWQNNLTASVTYPSPVAFTTSESPTQLVLLQNSNGFLDLTTCHTEPCARLDPPTVTIHIDAVAGSTSSTVALVEAPYSHPPANGYHVTAVTITPNPIVIKGDPAALARIDHITLQPVDLSGKTSDAVFQIQFTCPVDSCSATIASVKYSISPDPNVGPSPGP